MQCLMRCATTDTGRNSRNMTSDMWVLKVTQHTHFCFQLDAKYIQDMGTNLEKTMKSLMARPTDYHIEVRHNNMIHRL